ncbi:PF08922 domain protein [Leptospira interrogans str. 2006001854]|uniref:PF08922 domain protein n=1 Tax=Leptospira interrogans str. 2006001854 TaxID=1001590 RepID=M6G6R9_LEPIR|nr:PF08922 domain protein [Leptospira interrogans str. 2006001854]
MNSITIQFQARVWIYPGKGGWHFLTLPIKTSKEVRTILDKMPRSWGMVPVIAQIGVTNWNTSIFPEKNSIKYVLPLKADIRKKKNYSKSENSRFNYNSILILFRII